MGLIPTYPCISYELSEAAGRVHDGSKATARFAEEGGGERVETNGHRLLFSHIFINLNICTSASLVEYSFSLCLEASREA